MEIIKVEPKEVKVKEGLERFRQDMGDLDKLVKSIKRVGQILPIVISRENDLIDGGRRLAACAIAGIKVSCVYNDAVDPYEMRMLELEANLHRKDFTPAEQALAIRELHKLKQEKYGEGTSGAGKEDDNSWTITKTAELIGKSRATVHNALEMATLVDQFPQLKTAKKKSDIKKAARAIEKITTTVAGMAKNKEAIESGDNLFTILYEDAIEHMLSLKAGSIDILCTDPLYGIEADKLICSIGSTPGSKFTTSGYSIDDNTDKAMLSYEILAKESFRFTTEKAHGYVFVGPEYFWILRNIFITAGWRVHVKPLIWIKRGCGQCNVPPAWPASCYEMLMYIRKDNSTLIQEGRPDWIEIPPVTSGNKQHPYEKPVDLLIQLLERVSLPGQTVYDPFAGSGSTLEAATKLNLFSIGVDNSKEAYAVMLDRMNKLNKEDN